MKLSIASLAALGEPRLSYLGTEGILFEAPGAFDLEQQSRIWALCDAANSWEGVAEAFPGITNMTVILDRPELRDEIERRLLAAWATGASRSSEGQLLEVPIIYGGERGMHLIEVAEQLGLGVAEVVRIHTEPTYTVYAVGSHAGYCYLGGLDPRLFLPRRAVPLVSIPGGSLSIAGLQTGVSASAGPSGWHTIGHAEMRFFDVSRSPPTLLMPGDRVRFRAMKVVA